MNWTGYIFIGFGIASAIFIGGAFALSWAHKNGQLQNLEKGARTIFDDDEPEGQVSDAFPAKRKKIKRSKK